MLLEIGVSFKRYFRLFNAMTGLIRLLDSCLPRCRLLPDFLLSS